MKIWTLIENTCGRDDLTAEHGLSLYVETGAHKILFDAGQSSVFAENAARMGIDLAQVDIAILSHGHYDHGGGLGRFLEINKTAPVYVSRHAFGRHYNAADKYIGLDDSLRVCDRLVFVDDVLALDENLVLYSCNAHTRAFETPTYGLNRLENGVHTPEDFRHEQYLLIREGEKHVLLSGCSHKGILNIVNWFEPDVLVGGFHFMKLDAEQDAEILENAAQTLLRYRTRYYTGHCTGQAQYERLREIMGDQVSRLSTGVIAEI